MISIKFTNKLLSLNIQLYFELYYKGNQARLNSKIQLFSLAASHNYH